MRQAARNGGTASLAGIHTAALVVLASLAALLGASSAMAVETPPPAPVNTVAPTLSGTPAIGQTLTCSQGTWSNSPTSFAYAWLREGIAIPGQAGNSYVVQPTDTGHKISCQVTASDGGGNYTIVSLPSGSYSVHFTAEGGLFSNSASLNYIQQFYNGKATSSEATDVSVTAPNAVASIGAELQTGGEISGRVIDAVSKGAVKYVYACAEEMSAKPVNGGCEFTNSNGEYTIVGLPPGTYRVVFYPIFTETTYDGIFYNQKTLVGEADPVAVTAGSVTAGIDAELAPVSQGGKISGRVTAETGGAAIANVEVCADGTSGSSEGCATTNVNGEYTISDLAAGEFIVYFNNYGCVAGKCTHQNYVPQYYNDESSSTTANKILVIANNTTGSIDAKLLSGGQVKGVITAASGGARLAGVEVCAIQEYYEYGCEQTDVNGEYTLPGLATGQYTVRFETGSASVGNFAGQSIEKVTVTAPNPTTVNASLQTGGQLVGHVTSAVTHAAVAGIEVCADDESGVSFSECVETGADGEYAIAKMPAGSYSVSFYNENEKLNYLEQVHNGVSVAVGGQTSLNAEMQPGGTISGRVVSASTHAGIAGVSVCAREISGNEYTYCALTTGPASASATSASNALTIPSSNFTSAKPPKFDAKTGDLDFFFDFSSAGKLSWSLFFRNADVGFADSLGISLGANDSALAEVAKKKGKAKARKCKKAQTKHRGKCVATLVSFGHGSQSVPAGTVEVKVHADAKAIKALKAGRTLHVSGTFTFQSALGGPPVAHTVSTVVHLSKKAAKAKKHGKGKRR